MAKRDDMSRVRDPKALAKADRYEVCMHGDRGWKAELRNTFFTKHTTWSWWMPVFVAVEGVFVIPAAILAIPLLIVASIAGLANAWLDHHTWNSWRKLRLKAFGYEDTGDNHC